jgi:hypothetical protein
LVRSLSLRLVFIEQNVVPKSYDGIMYVTVLPERVGSHVFNSGTSLRCMIAFWQIVAHFCARIASWFPRFHWIEEQACGQE